MTVSLEHFERLLTKYMKLKNEHKKLKEKYIILLEVNKKSNDEIQNISNNLTEIYKNFINKKAGIIRPG